jgi:signal transduction histidine kinase
MTLDLGLDGQVLVIDDDTSFHDYLRYHIERAGLTLLTAADADDGLRTIEQASPDVVLLDYRLPRTDGLDVCRRIREDPDREFLPVILLSGYSSDELIRNAVAAGVNDFVDKAAPVQNLVLRVRAALRTKRLADLARRRYQELRFIKDVASDMASSLDEDAVLEVATRAFERFAPRAMYLFEAAASGRMSCKVVARRAPSLTAPATAACLEQARAALSVAFDPTDVELVHIAAEWSEGGGVEPIGRPLRVGVSEGLRAYVALVPAAPIDMEGIRLFESITDAMGVPLANARLFQQKEDANRELSEAMRILGRAQAQLVSTEKMASIGQLAAGVAHEINNPLAFVISNLNVLREYAREIRTLLKSAEGRGERRSRIDPDFLLDDLDSIVSESLEGAERVHAIVRDLKTFSHTPGGDVFEEVNLAAAVESTLNIAHAEVKHRAVLERELEPVPSIRGDRSKLSQVFLNLIFNAAQAVPSDADGRICVRLFERGGEVAVQVEDNGSGIPPDKRQQIFEPFFTTKEVGVGTGLGLAIANDTIQRHGGRIDVRSEVGHGTTFTVWLPSRNTVPIPRVSVEPSVVDQTEATVLFIDDESLCLSAYRRAFARCGRVLTAHGGEDGIRMIEQTPDIDVVFCDLLMPRVSGIDVFSHVRSERPELLDRFVVITGGQHGERAREFLDRTELQVVYKPFNIAEVSQLISRFAARRDRRQARPSAGA